MNFLHIEDEKWFHQSVAKTIATAFENSHTQWASSLPDALEKMSQTEFDVVLLDRNLGDTNSFDSIPQIRERLTSGTLIVLSSENDGAEILRALELGAHDYIIKTKSISNELPLRIRLAFSAKSHRPTRNSQSRLIGCSPYSDALRETIEKISNVAIPVMITGESGTGKEVIASEINRLSGNTMRPFVAVNCGAISENLFESELFGHVKGAFTGANQNHEGYVSRANKGDLFLDEIGELPLLQQVKLLRFIQEGTYTPVGSTVEKKSTARIIAATNQNLEAQVKANLFREDLYYRLNVYRIQTKPLRERPEDILPLAEHFISIFSNQPKRLNREAQKVLEKLEWKGNVRELSAVIQRAIVESDSDLIRANHIKIQNPGRLPLNQVDLPSSLNDVTAQSYENFRDHLTRAYLAHALALFEGDTAALAKSLKLSRATIYNQLNRLKIRNTQNGKKS